MPNAGAALTAYDSLLKNHILKHGRTVGADLRPPSATGMTAAPVQALLRANRKALTEVFRCGMPLLTDLKCHY